MTMSAGFLPTARESGKRSDEPEYLPRNVYSNTMSTSDAEKLRKE